MGMFYGAGEEANYLAGMAAATTKSNSIGGFVDRLFPIPGWSATYERLHVGCAGREPRRHGEGGVGQQTWFDPAPGPVRPPTSLAAPVAPTWSRRAVDSPAPQARPHRSKGIPWVGYDCGLSRKFAPTSWLTAAVYDWGRRTTLKRVKAAVERHLEDRQLLRLD